jgi:hypothetical protein
MRISIVDQTFFCRAFKNLLYVCNHLIDAGIEFFSDFLASPGWAPCFKNNSLKKSEFFFDVFSEKCDRPID